MYNGYLTTCALAISILILAVFILKKGMKNIETHIYKRMLICNILEAITTTLIVIFTYFNNSSYILPILNRLDIIFIITWISLLFYYVYCVSFNIVKDKQVKRIIYIRIMISWSNKYFCISNFLK